MSDTLPNQDIGKTLKPNIIKTKPMANRNLSNVTLSHDVRFKGENDEYEILANAESFIDEGGESIIYKAKRLSDGEELVAKIYIDFNKVRQGAIRDKITRFLKDNSDYMKTHIMPLIDEAYVLVTVNSNGRDEDALCPIDIIPYCNTSENLRFSYKELRENVIPQLLTALHIIHESGLVHRDIKPKNIYLYNGEIVIADFGTVRELIGDGFVRGHTKGKQGTTGYAALEIESEEYSIASDFYSLGCTIATFYKGKHVYQELVESGDTFRLRQAMKKGLVLDCSLDEEGLQFLVNALVKEVDTERATYEDVKLWLDDEAAFIIKWREKLSLDDDQKWRLNFEKITCNNAKELTDAIINKWEDGKRYLYRNTFAEFFAPQPGLSALADKVKDIIEDRETATNQELGIARFLHIINDGNCDIYWEGKSYPDLNTVSQMIYENKADANSIIRMLNNRFLSWKLTNRKEPAGQTEIDIVSEIEDLTTNYPLTGYYAFMYQFSSNNLLANEKTDSIFQNLIKDGNKWYIEAERFLNDDKVFACMFCLGYKQNVIEAKKSMTGLFFSNEKISDVQILYRLFDGICDDKKIVREHYLKYGPLAHLFWFQNNLNLYSFRSANAKSLERQIKGVEISVKMSINDIYRALTTLNQYYKDFITQFQNNHLFAYLGFEAEKESLGIFTDYTYAYLTEGFYDATVPVGYLKSIGR